MVEYFVGFLLWMGSLGYCFVEEENVYFCKEVFWDVRSLGCIMRRMKVMCMYIGVKYLSGYSFNKVFREGRVDCVWVLIYMVLLVRAGCNKGIIFGLVRFEGFVY